MSIDEHGDGTYLLFKNQDLDVQHEILVAPNGSDLNWAYDCSMAVGMAKQEKSETKGTARILTCTKHQLEGSGTAEWKPDSSGSKNLPNPGRGTCNEQEWWDDTSLPDRKNDDTGTDPLSGLDRHAGRSTNQDCELTNLKALTDLALPPTTSADDHPPKPALVPLPPRDEPGDLMPPNLEDTATPRLSQRSKLEHMKTADGARDDDEEQRRVEGSEGGDEDQRRKMLTSEQGEYSPTVYKQPATQQDRHQYNEHEHRLRHPSTSTLDPTTRLDLAIILLSLALELLDLLLKLLLAMARHPDLYLLRVVVVRPSTFSDIAQVPGDLPHGYLPPDRVELDMQNDILDPRPPTFPTSCLVLAAHNATLCRHYTGTGASYTASTAPCSPTSTPIKTTPASHRSPASCTSLNAP